MVEKTYQANEHTQRHDLRIAPPHLATDVARPAAECGGLARHDVGLVDEQLDALAAAQDLLHVLDHDVLHLVELRLCARELVGGGCGVVCMHQVGNGGAEGSLQAMCRGVGRRGRGRCAGELNVGVSAPM